MAKQKSKKKTFARNFLFFFPGCETEVKYIYPKETKKKLEKKPFIQPHQMPTKHAHAPNPSSLFQRNNNRNTREENAQETTTERGKRERRSDRQQPGDEMPAVISPAGHGLPSQ
jgi:hypothetical protein